ncbi:MAG: Helix-turn-helix domain [Actinomycetia bacterium]|nr:Helix-turn-helix domain [Actinomycetes bacterium]
MSSSRRQVGWPSRGPPVSPRHTARRALAPQHIRDRRHVRGPRARVSAPSIATRTVASTASTVQDLQARRGRVGGLHRALSVVVATADPSDALSPSALCGTCERRDANACRRMEPLLLTIGDAAHALGIGRSLLYELVAREQIRVVHLGRAVRVPSAELRTFVERQRELAERRR